MHVCVCVFHRCPLVFVFHGFHVFRVKAKCGLLRVVGGGGDDDDGIAASAASAKNL